MSYHAVAGKRPAMPEPGYSRIIIRATLLAGIIPGLSSGLRCWRALFPDYHPGYAVGRHYSRIIIRATLLAGIIPGLSSGLRCWRALFPNCHPGYAAGGHYSRIIIRATLLAGIIPGFSSGLRCWRATLLEGIYSRLRFRSSRGGQAGLPIPRSSA
jgi:predicted secreted protein